MALSHTEILLSVFPSYDYYTCWCMSNKLSVSFGYKPTTYPHLTKCIAYSTYTSMYHQNINITGNTLRETS